MDWKKILKAALIPSLVLIALILPILALFGIGFLMIIAILILPYAGYQAVKKYKLSVIDAALTGGIVVGTPSIMILLYMSLPLEISVILFASCIVIGAVFGAMGACVAKEKRNRLEIIVGFILALLTFLPFFIYLVYSAQNCKTIEEICSQYAATSYICTMRYLFYGLLPTIYVAYFILGLLLYTISLAFKAKTKAKIRFWAMVFLVAGIVGIVLVWITQLLNIPFCGCGCY